MTELAAEDQDADTVAEPGHGLVDGSGNVQEGPLGEGHDVDLPPERHLHLQLFPDVLHDRAFVNDDAVAQSIAKCSA